MSKKINIRPTTSVYATYKNIKYDPWTAIAEFVDNSTQSYYDNEVKLENTKYWDGLNIEIIYDKNSESGESLVIRDNAYGMEFEDFKRAIILDSPPHRASRSEFGMGLKTAACWFGTKWSVESTALGSKTKYMAIVDVDSLHKYRNEEIEVEEISCNPKDHGTTIRIWNLNRSISGRQIGKTKDQLRGIYRSDIRSGKIKIYYNGEQLAFDEPKILEETLPDGTTKLWKEMISFDVPYNGRKLNVNGFVALRDVASTSNAGFSLFHRGRVIVGGYENNYRPEEIFEKSNSFVYQRLFGELNMDEWQVTQSKDAFDWHNGLEDLLIDLLKIECAEYVKKAKEYRKGKKKDFDPLNEKTIKPFADAGIIDNVEVSDIPVKKNDSLNKILERQEDKGKVENIDNDSIVTRQLKFRSNGIEYIFNFKTLSSDPEKSWLSISKSNDEYNIEWNIIHPFFVQYASDKNFIHLMEQFIFALSLSEIESRISSENGLIQSSAIRLKMNDILKKVMR